MRNIKNTFSDDEKIALQDMIGKRLNFITGDGLNDSLLTAVLAVSTQDGTLTIVGDDICMDFEGFPNEFCKFQLNTLEPSRVRRMLDKGNKFITLAGAEIIGIHIFEEQISQFEGGKEVWRYLTEIAICFETNMGFLNVTKNNHHNGLIQVSYTEALPDLDSLKVAGMFYSDIFKSYVREISRYMLASGNL